MNETIREYRAIREIMTGKPSPHFSLQFDKDGEYYLMDGYMRKLDLETIDRWTEVLRSKL
jgi:hypothetical protein